MTVPQALDSVIPSPLVSRMKELVDQARRYREKMEEINREMVMLNEQIAKLNPRAKTEEGAVNSDT